MAASYREHYYEGHYRVVVLEDASERLYSIDVYRRLPEPPRACSEWLDVGGPSRLCYLPLAPRCEAVVVVSPDRVEIVNLRYKTPLGEDPFRGDASRAREECLKILRGILEEAGGLGGPNKSG